MRTFALQLLCLLALLACAPFAHAQQQVYRCIGAHGEPVFSGQPCGTPATQPGQPGSVQANASGGVCAGSPRELRQDIAQAFATHDVNRLAGLILWRGMDQASARATLHGLSMWLKQPLAGIATEHANGPPLAGADPPSSLSETAAASSTPVPSPSGLEVSTGGGGGSTRAFGITEFGGCWWLTF